MAALAALAATLQSPGLASPPSGRRALSAETFGDAAVGPSGSSAATVCLRDGLDWVGVAVLEEALPLSGSDSSPRFAYTAGGNGMWVLLPQLLCEPGKELSGVDEPRRERGRRSRFVVWRSDGVALRFGTLAIVGVPRRIAVELCRGPSGSKTSRAPLRAPLRGEQRCRSLRMLAGLGWRVALN